MSTSQQSGKFSTKIYVVIQRIHLATDGEPNTQIIAVRLTRQSAQEVVDQNPGTSIERHIACK